MMISAWVAVAIILTADGATVDKSPPLKDRAACEQVVAAAKDEVKLHDEVLAFGASCVEVQVGEREKDGGHVDHLNPSLDGKTINGKTNV